jgi:hypothetical protein
VTERRTRDRYAEVGEATRAAIEAAIATAEGRELTRYARALLAVLHWTASRSRLGDNVYLPQLTGLAKIAGDDDGKHTADALHLAHDRGVLVWKPSHITGKPSWVGLPGSLAQQLPILSSVRGATKASSGGPLSAEIADLSGPPSEKDQDTELRARGSRRLIWNDDRRPCFVCDRVETIGGLHQTLWFCEQHLTDVEAA